jgi:SAM-dependent methyltransferase
MRDASNGYERIAEHFSRARNRSIGPAVVRRWARTLPAGAAVLDLGCGNGIPISETLIEEGLAVCGVDASPTLVAKFRDRFPDIPVECSAVEESTFFNRTFDAAIAWGLLFLLPADIQRAVIGRVARTLVSGGRFLFTAPREPCTWTDVMTGVTSQSLGQDAYQRELQSHGLELVENDTDEGENYYYFSVKR